jgi:hypothetical protein
MEKVHYTPCSLCNEQGHSHSKCPSLSSPLKVGFYTGGGGGGSHSHDDDECISKTNLYKQNKCQQENISICISPGDLLL